MMINYDRNLILLYIILYLHRSTSFEDIMIVNSNSHHHHKNSSTNTMSYISTNEFHPVLRPLSSPLSNNNNNNNSYINNSNSNSNSSSNMRKDFVLTPERTTRVSAVTSTISTPPTTTITSSTNTTNSIIRHKQSSPLTIISSSTNINDDNNSFNNMKGNGVIFPDIHNKNEFTSNTDNNGNKVNRDLNNYHDHNSSVYSKSESSHGNRMMSMNNDLIFPSEGSLLEHSSILSDFDNNNNHDNDEDNDLSRICSPLTTKVDVPSLSILSPRHTAATTNMTIIPSVMNYDSNCSFIDLSNTTTIINNSNNIINSSRSAYAKDQWKLRPSVATLIKANNNHHHHANNRNNNYSTTTSNTYNANGSSSAFKQNNNLLSPSPPNNSNMNTISNRRMKTIRKFNSSNGSHHDNGNSANHLKDPQNLWYRDYKDLSKLGNNMIMMITYVTIYDISR